MKPKTKLQIEVWDLHKKLPEPVAHEPFMISKHQFYYTTHYKNIICLECNHNWKPSQVWHEEVIGVECPSCNKKLKKVDTQNGGLAQRVIAFSVVNVVERFQVIRYFSCWKYLSKNKKPKYRFRSLFEEWSEFDKNKKVVVGRNTANYGDGFKDGNYEVRYNKSRWGSMTDYDRFNSDYNCPGAEFLPRFDKYQLTKFDHECDYRTLIHKLDYCPRIETLLKIRQKELLLFAVHNDSNGNVGRFWPSIKIAVRNKYNIKDAGIWFDYLQLLTWFNKDLHSPKYICPKNLKKEHDRLVAKKRIIQNREKIEKQRKKVAKAQIEYEKLKANFFGLMFTDGEITIKVLDSVQEFMEEGDALKHCLFTNEYYNKPDSLVLSARIQEKPIETIEVSLSKMKIIQSRGLQNKASEYNNRIIKLVNSNLKTIKTIANKKESLNQLIAS